MADTLFKITYYTFVACIVALGLLLLVSAVPVAHIEVKIVESGSMAPAIHTGSIVVIRAQKSYRVGDVITFFYSMRDETPTTHRIVEIKEADGEKRYVTKGDANENEDPNTIEEEAVVGKVLFSVRFVGYILEFAKKPLGFALIIGIPALYIIFDEGLKIYTEVRRILKEEKEKKEKEDTDTHV